MHSIREVTEPKYREFDIYGLTHQEVNLIVNALYNDAEKLQQGHPAAATLLRGLIEQIQKVFIR